MTKIDLRPYSKLVIAGVFFIFLHSLRYFDFIGLNETIYGNCSKLFALFLIILCVISKSPRQMPGRYWWIALLAVPMLSFLPAWLENGQSPVESFKAYLPFGLALIYFILHSAKIRPSEIARIFTVFAIIRLLIYITQQFTFPHYLFAFRTEGFNSFGYYAGIEMRSGIYRYYIEDTYLSMFLVFYYLQRLLKSRRLTDLVFLFIGLIGVYLDQSRQFMVSTVVAVLFVIFFASKIKYKGLILLGMAGVAAILLSFSEQIFGDLLFMTQDDLSSDNIRLLAYTTFALEFWGGTLSVIFGNGPIGHSAYGEKVAYLNQNMNLYHADVGIVGAANLYGIVTVLMLLVFFLFFVVRNWRKLQTHLKMYYVAMVVNLPLVTIYTQNLNWFVFFAFMLYLSDRSIIGYDRRMHKLRESRAVKTEEHT